MTNDANPETTPLSSKDSASEKIQFEVLLATKLKSLEGELADTRRLLSETKEQEVRPTLTNVCAFILF